MTLSVVITYVDYCIIVCDTRGLILVTAVTHLSLSNLPIFAYACEWHECVSFWSKCSNALLKHYSWFNFAIISTPTLWPLLCSTRVSPSISQACVGVNWGHTTSLDEIAATPCMLSSCISINYDLGEGIRYSRLTQWITRLPWVIIRADVLQLVCTATNTVNIADNSMCGNKNGCSINKLKRVWYTLAYIFIFYCITLLPFFADDHCVLSLHSRVTDWRRRLGTSVQNWNCYYGQRLFELFI